MSLSQFRINGLHCSSEIILTCSWRLVREQMTRGSWYIKTGIISITNRCNERPENLIAAKWSWWGKYSTDSSDRVLRSQGSYFLMTGRVTDSVRHSKLNPPVHTVRGERGIAGAQWGEDDGWGKTRCFIVSKPHCGCSHANKNTVHHLNHNETSPMCAAVRVWLIMHIKTQLCLPLLYFSDPVDIFAA